MVELRFATVHTCKPLKACCLSRKTRGNAFAFTPVHVIAGLVDRPPEWRHERRIICTKEIRTIGTAEHSPKIAFCTQGDPDFS